MLRRTLFLFCSFGSGGGAYVYIGGQRGSTSTTDVTVALAFSEFIGNEASTGWFCDVVYAYSMTYG